MHQIAPFLSPFFSGEHAPDPPSTSANQHHNRANYTPGFYKKTLVNVDQGPELQCLLRVKEDLS